MNDQKQKVYEFWNQSSCGEDLYLNSEDKQGYDKQAEERYKLEGKIIFDFAKFSSARDLKVLEIGVGLGADHQQFAQAGADLYGVDLTEKAIKHTAKRLKYFNLYSNLSVADAEELKFADNSFDVIYSWGVLHHSPNTTKAISEVYRVLKPGGVARVMIYHKWSIVGYMLWFRYALMRARWFTLDDVYSQYLESHGTKAYSMKDANILFSDFKNVLINTPLTHGDLLESKVGQRHRGLLLTVATKIWPRWFFRAAMKNSGLFMMIEAKK